MITAIIIDDEQHCIDRLSFLLEKNFAADISLLGKFKTTETGLKAINDLQPELIFLDVQIDDDKTGFDLLKQIQNINFEVIFTTAFEKYAVQAFKFSAIDYLLKPVDADDLRQAINKLKERISQTSAADKFEVLYHNLKNLSHFSKRICVPIINGFVVVQVSDIIRCESEGNYTTLFIKDKPKLMVAKTLKEFDEMLSEYNFFRVHNSHLINLNYIKTYNKGKGGFVIMTDNSSIEVSTRRKDEFLKKLMAV